MADWRSFEDAEPALAQRAHAIVASTTNCVLGTSRADGSPRLSGIDPWFFDGELWFGSMEGARKGADLARDPRLSLHGIPWESRRVRADATDPGDGDAKVTGRAVHVTDPSRQAAVMAHLAKARGFDPPPGGDLYAVDLATVVVVSVEDDQLVIDRWSALDGRTTIRRS